MVVYVSQYCSLFGAFVECCALCRQRLCGKTNKFRSSLYSFRFFPSSQGRVMTDGRLEPEHCSNPRLLRCSNNVPRQSTDNSTRTRICNGPCPRILAEPGLKNLVNCIHHYSYYISTAKSWSVSDRHRSIVFGRLQLRPNEKAYCSPSSYHVVSGASSVIINHHQALDSVSTGGSLCWIVHLEEGFIKLRMYFRFRRQGRCTRATNTPSVSLLLSHLS